MSFCVSSSSNRAMSCAIGSVVNTGRPCAVWVRAGRGRSFYCVDGFSDWVQMNHDLAGHRLYAIVHPKRRSR